VTSTGDMDISVWYDRISVERRGGDIKTIVDAVLGEERMVTSADQARMVTRSKLPGDGMSPSKFVMDSILEEIEAVASRAPLALSARQLAPRPSSDRRVTDISIIDECMHEGDGVPAIDHRAAACKLRADVRTKAIECPHPRYVGDNVTCAWCGKSEDE
jgi:hypothetical protein